MTASSPLGDVEVQMGQGHHVLSVGYAHATGQESVDSGEDRDRNQPTATIPGGSQHWASLG